VGGRNDYDGVRAAGHNRAINRQKYDLQTIEAALAGEEWLRQQIYTRLGQLIQLRRRQPAFHPDNPMTISESENALLVLRRHSPDSDEGLLCVFNLSGRPVETPLPEARMWQDLISGEKMDGTQPVKLDAWQFMWLR
jgi:sucrose phosphorylase